MKKLIKKIYTFLTTYSKDSEFFMGTRERYKWKSLSNNVIKQDAP